MNWLDTHVGCGPLTPARGEVADNSRTVRQYLDDIKNGRWEIEIDLIRNALLGEEPDEADRQKKQLPGITWSGTFAQRAKAGLLAHSGLICADIDDAEEWDAIASLRRRIEADPVVAAVFRSPSGLGLKVLVRADPVPKDQEEHGKLFDALQAHFFEHHCVPIDAACRDVSRLCFASHDPQLFVREESQPLEWRSPSPLKPKRVVEAQVENVPPGDDYDARADIPALLKSHGWKMLQGGKYWTRPGKKSGISASWDTIPAMPRRFWCFSSSTEFEQNHLYRPWHVYAILEHGGDFKAAARALAGQGYGVRATPADDGGASLGPEADEDEPLAAEGMSWKTSEERELPVLPSIVSAEDEDANPPETPKQVIETVLYRGAKMMIAGPSKVRKTFLLMDLAESVANGVPWLGFKTVQSNVLYLNFELQAFDSRKRRIAIESAKFKGRQKSNVHFWHLRGALSRRGVNPKNTYAAIIDGVSHFSQTHDCGLIIVDPIYKLTQMCGEENKAEDVGRLMNELDMLAVETGAAVAFCHHFAKGNAAGRDAIDRASGSGVYARDPDAMLFMTPNEEEDCVSIEMSLRNFSAIDAFGARWTFPLWSRDQAVVAENIKGAKGEAKKSLTAAQLSAELPRFGGRVTASNATLIAEFFGVSVSTVWRVWKAVKELSEERCDF